MSLLKLLLSPWWRLIRVVLRTKWSSWRCAHILGFGWIVLQALLCRCRVVALRLVQAELTVWNLESVRYFYRHAGATSVWLLTLRWPLDNLVPVLALVHSKSGHCIWAYLSNRHGLFGYSHQYLVRASSRLLPCCCLCCSFINWILTIWTASQIRGLDHRVQGYCRILELHC